jgi:hypothetical protein
MRDETWLDVLKAAIVWAVVVFGPPFVVGFMEPHGLGNEERYWLVFGIWAIEALLWTEHKRAVRRAVEDAERLWRQQAEDALRQRGLGE